MRRPVAWGDYASRLLSCALLFLTGFVLVANSPFAMRMRNDIPLSLWGFDGPQSIALIVAAVLSVIPLLAGPAFLGTFLTCGWLMSGMGAYWWTLIPWDEWITDSGFPTSTPPGLTDFILVAGPALVATLHVILARVSRLRRDAKERGVDEEETRRAAAAAFLTGGATLVLAFGLAAVLWLLLGGGLGSVQWGLVGLPALVVCAAVTCAAWAISTRRARKLALRRPSPDAADRAGRARSRGRRSPS